MSGISGFCGFGADYSQQTISYEYLLKRMTGVLSHRGQGHPSIWVGARTGLASRADGINNQAPMRIDAYGPYRVISDSDIYNADELRHLLASKGFVCQTADDAEIILGCYIYYGQDCASMLNGTYAFAIWDEAAGSLFLCRDRLGVKPLFHTITRGTLVFASEIKALFEFPGVNAALDADGLREIFGLFPSRTAGNAVFKDIHEVKPGHYAIYKDSVLREHSYWSVASLTNDFTHEEAVAHTRYLVEDAVKRQMKTDAPLCVFLSGGLDSSIITAIVANAYAEESRTLDSFSFDYEENDTYFQANSFQSDTDQSWAEQMSAQFQTNHHHIVCGIKDLAGSLYDAVTARDLPGMADIDASLLYFCKQAAKTHRIALTGEGADELFGGYPWFHDPAALQANAFPWIRSLDFRKTLLSPALLPMLDLDGYIAEAYQKSASETPFLDGEDEQERNHRKMAYLNMKWVMANLIERTERMGAHVSFVGRTPYTDYRIVEFLWNIPWQTKCTGAPKSLLREAFADLLPDALINRKKNPFPKTYHPQYTALLKAKMAQILNDPSSPLLPLLNVAAFEDFLTAPINTTKPWYGQLMAGPQLIAFYIQIDYWLRKYSVSVL